MRTTHKAKDLNGKWVEGWYTYASKETGYEMHLIWFDDPNAIGGQDWTEINPSTICERVPSRDYYLNDIVRVTDQADGLISEMIPMDRDLVIGYDMASCSYFLEELDESNGYAINECLAIKPTCSNKHDNER